MTEAIAVATAGEVIMPLLQLQACQSPEPASSSATTRARSDTAADDSDLLHTAARIRHRFEALDGICDATRRTWTPEPGRGASSST
jgi:hypothetical protein